MAIAVLALAAVGFAVSFQRTDKDLRARNLVERGMLALLIAAASIAILTTLGIVLSLIFNTLEFFRLYPAWEFFTSLTWSPSFGGGSELGILPLLWGTLYISFIALAVAVPIGLFAAIYLSEYASPRIRSIVKPLLEVLAGIPTIVYGLFALLTVGPLLVDIFGDGGLLGVGWMKGGTAVMTAGLVMGVMLIPFVSSLSDDIINAVPQAMRDGSYGLGATQSETVRQVVLPAALPGIVGRDPAGRQPRHRRDDDRGSGGRGGGETVDEPVRGDDHRDRQDRQPVDRRHRFRLARGAGRLRAWHDAVRHHAGAEHLRALYRAQIPGAVRMTDASAPSGGKTSLYTVDPRTRRRNAAEKRFRAYGIVAISVSLLFLAVLLGTIIRNGLPAFQQTFISVPVLLDEAKLDKNGNRDPADLAKVTTFGYGPMIDEALQAHIADLGIETPFDQGQGVRRDPVLQCCRRGA